MVITVDSNFAADKETVQTFLTGLSSVQSDFNGKIKPEHDTIRGISCESWPDVVGQSFKARIKELSDNLYSILASRLDTFGRVDNPIIAFPFPLSDRLLKSSEIVPK